MVKMPVVKLHELKPGQLPADFFALLTEKVRNTTRDKKPFYNCKFRNMHRTVESVIWADATLFPQCDKDWTIGSIYKLRGTFGEHERYGPQVDIINARLATPADKDDGFNESDFYERSRFDSEEMFAELLAILDAELKDAPLKVLVLGILNANADALKALPASPKQFYPFPGGWLEHVRNVLRNCIWLADQYAERFPELLPFNRDLVLAGAALHDIGRVAELIVPLPGQPPEMTVPGYLIGHIPLARDIIRDAGKTIEELNPELLLLLEHIVLAHLSLPAWGSPRLPMIAEVLILHHADDLDAKFEMFARHISRDAKDGPVTERDSILGKPLLKARTV